MLDNFEQVLEAAPVLVRLLSTASELKILVTSRSILNVTGEHTFELGPLGLPRAGGLLGAAESQRDRSGLYNPPGGTFYQLALDRMLAGGTHAEFEVARSRGRRLSLDDALIFADPDWQRAGHRPPPGGVHVTAPDNPTPGGGP